MSDQVVKGNELAPANLSDQHLSLYNAVETSYFQHETSVDEFFAILNSNLQADEQQ